MKDVKIELVPSKKNLIDHLTNHYSSKNIIIKESDMIFDTCMINFSANGRLLVYMPCSQSVGYKWH
jgi:hypothetical protein